MLKEYKKVRQIQGEARRRWFGDDFFDLIVWFDEENNITGFQLCYDIFKASRSLTWHQNTGYSHNRVDDGEDRPGKMKASPILVANGIFEYKKIARKFRQESRQLESRIVTLVYDKIMGYG